jgi:hypothetical protein
MENYMSKYNLWTGAVGDSVDNPVGELCRVDTIG